MCPCLLETRRARVQSIRENSLSRGVELKQSQKRTLLYSLKIRKCSPCTSIVLHPQSGHQSIVCQFRHPKKSFLFGAKSRYALKFKALTLRGRGYGSHFYHRVWLWGSATCKHLRCLFITDVKFKEKYVQRYLARSNQLDR